MNLLSETWFGILSNGVCVTLQTVNARRSNCGNVIIKLLQYLLNILDKGFCRFTPYTYLILV